MRPISSKHPALYEAFARHWAPRGFAAVPDEELDRLAALGFDYIWVMGVWTLGAFGTRLARSVFPGHSPDELESSPYAIARYEVDARYGGPEALAALRRRLAKRNMGLIVDFVPNHTARDHDWIRSHPEYYVHDETGIACGKDPYFPAWSDTAQIDHRLAATRDALLATLQSIATQADGVRCDMAMLVLSDVFEKTWGHLPAGGARARGEFWAEAIDRLPRDFLWIAEAYWGLEQRLQQLGFDFTYDKSLYDHLMYGTAGEVRSDLAGPADYQARSLRFLENHDEPRLAATLPIDRASAALAITLTSPGMRFVHDGQMGARTEHATIQLARRPEEDRPEDRLAIRAVHEKLLRLPRRGSFAQLATTCDQLVAHRWDDPDGPLVVVVNYSGERAQGFVTLDLHRMAGRKLELHDVMGGATYIRDGSAPLYVDLQPWRSHVFTVKAQGVWYG